MLEGLFPNGGIGAAGAGDAQAQSAQCHLFVFRGRRGSLIKVLWHDGQGMCLFARRLERWRFIWPSIVAITARQPGARGLVAKYFEGCDQHHRNSGHRRRQSARTSRGAYIGDCRCRFCTVMRGRSPLAAPAVLSETLIHLEVGGDYAPVAGIRSDSCSNCRSLCCSLYRRGRSACVI